jgi:hypothetical protein
VKSWEQISSDPDPKNKTLEKEGIDARLKTTDHSAALLADASLRARGFIPVTTSAVQPPEIGKDTPAQPDGVSIPIEILQKIHATSGADAVFRFRITDLGTMPDIDMNWITAGTIAFVTGVTVVTYANPATHKLIGAYLASEVVQEGTEAYLGYSLIDHYYRFVRVEAELIDVSTGKIIWQDASTCAGKGKLLEEYPLASRDKTETQITVALRRALDELAISASEARGVFLQT